MRVMLLAVLMSILPMPGQAHDIPNDVLVRAFVKPEGRSLWLLARVPLEAMREADIPLRGPGYVDLARADAALRVAANLWLADNIEIREGDTRLEAPRLEGARVALASDRSFESYAQALATVRAPALPATLDLYWKQQFLDVLLEYPIASDRAEFAIQPRLARLGLQVRVALRFLPTGGEERAFDIHGDAGLVRLDPRWHHVALRFAEQGFFHILEGADHLLFLACLVIPFRRFGALVIIATAFTLAHSLTLAASAFGLAPGGLWFAPLVETLIAASIVFMALENIVAAHPARRWVLAFAFGLVHGFGFAFALRESLQFAGTHLATALLAFNAGVELGQVAALLLLVPALSLAFRYIPERLGTIVLSALVAHTAWHWLVERFADLRKFPFPALDAASAASLMRWAMAGVVTCFLLWMANRKVRTWLSR